MSKITTKELADTMERTFTIQDGDRVICDVQRMTFTQFEKFFKYSYAYPHPAPDIEFPEGWKNQLELGDCVCIYEYEIRTWNI